MCFVWSLLSDGDTCLPAHGSATALDSASVRLGTQVFSESHISPFPHSRGPFRLCVWGTRLSPLEGAGLVQ